MERSNGRSRQVGRFFMGVLIGGLAGAVTALFAAPHSGAETRQQIRDKTSEIRDRAEQSVMDARSRVEEVSDRVAQRATEFRSRGQSALGESEKHLSKAVDETKQAADAWRRA